MKFWKTIPALLIAAGAAHAQPTVIEVIPAVTSGDVDEFAISPDGTKIAFVGTLDGDTADQVYVIDIAGGNATLLNPAGVGDVDGGIVWTPDGTGVIARYGGGDGNIDNQFYLMAADGSQTATQLTFNDSNVFDAQVSADGSTLYYIDAVDDGVVNDDDLLYATSITSPGGSPTLITPDAFAEIDTGSYAQTGSDIVYAGSLPGEGETRFYRTAADGSNAATPVEITISNAPGDFTYDIDEMAVTPDGESIVFIADLSTDGVDELYTMDIDGGEATRLLPNIPGFTDIGPFVISDNGEFIAFQADYDVNGGGELYVMSLTDGSVDPTRLTFFDDLAYNSDVVAGVGRLAFTAGGEQIVFLADGRTNGVNELFIINNPIPAPGALGALAGLALLGRRRG